MTIKINSDWYGNTHKFEFETAQEAVAHMESNPSYEYLCDSRVRPYGDIDHKVPEDMTYEEFNELDWALYLGLANDVQKMGRKITIYQSSSYEMRKISHRWVIPDVYVDSPKHAGEFAKHFYSRIELPKGIVPDMSIYNKNRKMRMVGTSKPGENRPLEMIQGEIEDTLITYIPGDAEHIPVDLPVRNEYVATPSVDIPDGTMKQLLDCIRVEAWTDYNTCMLLVWAMCKEGVDAGTIHSYTAKAKNYGAKWVDGLIRTHTPDVSPSIAYIRTQARLSNPSAYTKIDLPAMTSTARNNSTEHIQKLLKLTTDDSTIIDQGRYLMPMPAFRYEIVKKLNSMIEEKRLLRQTLAVKAHLGLGKTTRIKEMIRNNLDKRILVLASRCSWTNSIFAELKDTGFAHYDDEKARLKKDKVKDPQITADKLIIQLHPESMKFINTQAYDIIVCDEVETLMSLMTRNGTYNSTESYVMMYEMFERFMKETPVVWAFDAFLSDRTMNMLKMLRKDVQLIVNTTNPYSKTATILKSEEEFNITLRRRIQYGKKRVVSVWGGEKKGAEFHKSLTDANIPNVFYSGETNKKEKAEHMADVNTHWANYQSVGYTSTIMVGINYDNPEAKFDQVSLYATAYSCMPRDYAQCLYRARALNDDEVLVHISPSRQKVDYEYVDQEDAWDAEIQLNRNLLKAFGEKEESYKRIPAWLRQVILWNRNEKYLSNMYFEEFMLTYLEMCGINTSNQRGEKATLKRSANGESVPVESVRIIEHAEADYLICNPREQSVDDQLALKLYMMSQYTDVRDQFIWDMWLKDERVIKNAYELLVSADPKYMLEKQKVKVLELLPRNIAKIKVVREMLLDWKTSWEVPVDKMPVVSLEEFHTRVRTEKETTEQYCRELCRSIQDWCGFAVSVKRKRIRNGRVLSYEYSVVYEYDRSTAKYIEAPAFE